MYMLEEKIQTGIEDLDIKIQVMEYRENLYR